MIANEIKWKTESTGKAFAEKLSAAGFNNESIYGILEEFLKDNPELFSVSFAFAPQASGESILKSAPLAFRSNGDIKSADVYKNGEDYNDSEWYREPVKVKKSCWSSNNGSRFIMNKRLDSFSVPIYKDSGKSRLLGVLTLDILHREAARYRQPAT